MKKYILVFVVLSIFLISGCSKESSLVDEKKDVILKHEKIVNLNEFKSFVENVKLEKPDKVKIVSYTDEGDPIVKTLNYDGKEIRYSIDNSNDKFSSENNKEQKTVCKKLNKRQENSQVVYYLDECSQKDIDNMLLNIPMEG
ncbi:DUF4362 domain-containing protein [Bacillus cereus]|uniref:DUF4362 domain-containing protein n=1 Tax=Bacillus cereus TaxID=1396 RepID=A0A9X6SVG3_BACCE|nr:MULTISPECIES: DUF4362 domain-containing protein [Bacillus]KAF6688699.1 DUF4362 domain-containing protein [Bacillus sp. EKM501B]MDA2379396.1 DUF4362 domain-containing protein [Bacillus cereus]MDF3555367.1 DUF4362 domain-containing protein [Bacillus cereus]MEB9547467.1 DUF4362 domain-containing protein [Bacillus cereus]MEB9834217.1 DUF4362 domain-containing protein [Bacillus cereus]